MTKSGDCAYIQQPHKLEFEDIICALKKLPMMGSLLFFPYQHFLQAVYPLLLASDIETLLGPFIPLQLGLEWYFLPDLGIHTICALLSS